MNLVIFGVTLARQKKVVYALPLLYGIGLSRSRQICRDLGLAPQLTIGELTENQQYSLAKYIKENFLVEGNLEEYLKQKILHYTSNGSRRGYRLRNGLPVRGQRTHTNAKTARRRTYTRSLSL
jgi:small subunit ribosomal protein S13